MSKKKTTSGATLNIIDPERFARIREAMAARGLGELSLSAMVRIALDEWVAHEKNYGVPARTSTRPDSSVALSPSANTAATA